MAKAARRYDLYLPLRDNNRQPFPGTLLDSVEQRLMARFGGLTMQQRGFPLRGIWQESARVYVDEIIIMSVLDFRPQGSARFISQLKKALLHEFDQLEILITEQFLRVH